MFNYKLKEIENFGYDISSMQNIGSDCTQWQLRKYAKENDVLLDDCHGFRLEDKLWAIFYKKNKIKGYIEYPVLNF